MLMVVGMLVIFVLLTADESVDKDGHPDQDDDNHGYGYAVMPIIMLLPLPGMIQRVHDKVQSSHWPVTPEESRVGNCVFRSCGWGCGRVDSPACTCP